MSTAAAALLDELMGRNRNAGADEKNALKWDSEQTCKHYLAGYCPNDLFTNTKADLGVCSKLHDEVFLKEYRGSSRFEKLGYEEDFVEFLESMISDVDKRIKRGHARLAAGGDEGGLSTSGPGGPKQDKVRQLTSKIDDLVEQAEKLGCEGKVEEAQGVMKLCDQLRKERQQLEHSENRESNSVIKQMEVCPVCGAFLIVGDAESRQKEHLLGKQHMGYAQLRATVAEFAEKKRQKVAAERAERERAMEERRKRNRSPDRRRRSRSRDRDSRRGNFRDSRRGSSRERRRSRDRGGRRSRSRSRDRRRTRDDRRRSNSRERRRSRDKRSRSRDRRRSRSHERRRSRSRDRKRSRSRDRKRSRERRRDSQQKTDSRRSSRERGGSREKKSESKTNGNEEEKNGASPEQMDTAERQISPERDSPGEDNSMAAETTSD